MKTLKLFSVVFILLLLSSCCPLTGQVYQRIDKIPDESGLVYFYRLNRFRAAGTSPNLYINNGSTYIFSMCNGGYYPYYSKPGKTVFMASTTVDRTITLDIAPGGVYYVKLTMDFIFGSFLLAPNLTIVNNEVAEKEIINCELIRPK